MNKQKNIEHTQEQAFCTFTIEAWVHGKQAVLFCNNKLIKVVDNWDGPGSVRI